MCSSLYPISQSALDIWDIQRGKNSVSQEAVSMIWFITLLLNIHNPCDERYKNCNIRIVQLIMHGSR